MYTLQNLLIVTIGKLVSCRPKESFIVYSIDMHHSLISSAISVFKDLKINFFLQSVIDNLFGQKKK